MLFLYGCACLSFSDILAYGYAVMMLNVLRSDITIKNSTDRTDLTFCYPIEALYKEPFGYIEREGN